MIGIKRVYDKPCREDGCRILVDRLWPRGLTKQAARIEAWMKDVAPSDELRRWFAHDPGRWGEFKRRYFAELAAHGEAVAALIQKAGKGNVTLVFAAQDGQFNNAAALREYLGQHA